MKVDQACDNLICGYEKTIKYLLPTVSSHMVSKFSYFQIIVEFEAALFK